MIIKMDIYIKALIRQLVKKMRLMEMIFLKAPHLHHLDMEYLDQEGLRMKKCECFLFIFFFFSSNTPNLLNLGSEKRKCSATTRQGKPCNLSAQIGRDYCFRHQTGTSVIH